MLSVSHENALNNFLDLVFKFAFKFSWHLFVVVAVVVLEEKQQNECFPTVGKFGVLGPLSSYQKLTFQALFLR